MVETLPRKILIFCQDIPPTWGNPTAGGGVRCWGLAKGMESRGHSVFISVPRPNVIDVPGAPAEAKELSHMPGDTVEIDKNNQISINKQLYATGLMWAQEKLGQPDSYFQGKTTLAENQYWFLGASEKSFDSRYWGAVNHEDIIGRVYPIF